MTGLVASGVVPKAILIHLYAYFDAGIPSETRLLWRPIDEFQWTVIDPFETA